MVERAKYRFFRELQLKHTYHEKMKIKVFIIFILSKRWNNEKQLKWNLSDDLLLFFECGVWISLNPHGYFECNYMGYWSCIIATNIIKGTVKKYYGGLNSCCLMIGNSWDDHWVMIIFICNDSLLKFLFEIWYLIWNLNPFKPGLFETGESSFICFVIAWCWSWKLTWKELRNVILCFYKGKFEQQEGFQTTCLQI